MHGLGGPINSLGVSLAVIKHTIQRGEMDNHTTFRVVDNVNESSKEYQLLKAYCAKRQRQNIIVKNIIHIRGPEKALYKRKKKNVAHTFAGAAMLVNQGAVPVMTRVVPQGPVRTGMASQSPAHEAPTEEGSTLSGLANKLTEIADSTHIPEHVEKDGQEDLDDVIKKLVDLLRTAGDKLNEEITQNKALQAQLQSSFNYTMFEKVTSMLQGMVGTSSMGQAAESALSLQRKQIAWAFEVTSRLSAVDLIPMSRSMGFGERYVQLHHSAWVQQNGGWEKVFHDDDDID